MAGTVTPVDAQLAEALARVAELESDLQACENAAQSARQELQHFVYAASHDLQEPLRAVTAYAQLLERMYANDEQAKEFTSFIINGVTRMNGLLYSLLAYSRVNMNPALQNVRLSAAVQMALFKLAGLIKESGAAVRCLDLPDIPAHDGQMSQLFEQLLSNSILYRGSQAPEIEISAEEGELSGEAVQFVRIKDNGAGIEDQFLVQVIQPFKRLHGKDYPGYGLGLAICEKIMRAHNGKLWIESDGKSGSTVHLAFPL